MVSNTAKNRTLERQLASLQTIAAGVVDGYAQDTVGFLNGATTNTQSPDVADYGKDADKAGIGGSADGILDTGSSSTCESRTQDDTVGFKFILENNLSGVLASSSTVDGVATASRVASAQRYIVSSCAYESKTEDDPDANMERPSSVELDRLCSDGKPTMDKAAAAPHAPLVAEMKLIAMGNVSLSVTESKTEKDPASETKRNDQGRALPRTTSQPDTAVLLKLKDMNPETPAGWTFVACVVARNPVRDWNTWQGAGSMQELFVTDSMRGCTHVTLFDDAIESYRAAVVPGATCRFSGGRVKRAFARKNEIEISFGSGSNIRPVADPPSIVPCFSEVRLADLVTLSEGSTATTIAVVRAVGSLKRLATKRGKAVEKRDLLIVGDNGFSVVCTTRNLLARNNEDISEGTIVLVRNEILSTYNNLRSISIGVISDLLHDPALPHADRLREWYEALSPDHHFSSLAMG